MEPIVDVEITAPDVAWLTAFTRRVVADGLAASGNVIDGVRSIYRWQGAIEDAPEALVRLHTRRSLVPALRDRTDAEHPYDVPGFRVSPIEASPAYHRWVLDETTGPSTRT
jgi:periplasmic divalent cation tolerance protein